MKIKTTAIIFALFMALQFAVSAQTQETKADNSKVLKQPVQKEMAVEKQAAPANIDPMKSETTTAPAPCCKGKAEAGCQGQKSGSKECCKDKAKTGEGCKGHTEGKSGCGHQHGENKSSDCKGHTKATGDAKSSKGCCHR